MDQQTITAKEMEVKILEYLMHLWNKGELSEEMKDYVVEKVPILRYVIERERS